jgi:hypothetical protein
MTGLRTFFSSFSTPYSLLVLRLPSIPELELAFVCTSSRLLVELSLLANSWKLRRLTLVLLLLFSLSDELALRLLPELVPLSLRLGMVTAETERDGRARLLGRLVLFRDEVVPARGRRPPPDEGGGPL